jgi:hypothetical protein
MKRSLLVTGWLWAFPMTLLGLLVAFTGGAMPYRLRQAGVLQFVARRGVWRWFFDRFFVDAITFGAVTIFVEACQDSAPMIRHERQHTYQCFVLGPLFPVVYYGAGVLAAVCGGRFYRDNALERQAYNIEWDVNG